MPNKTHPFRFLTFAAALALAPFAFVAAAPATAQAKGIRFFDVIDQSGLGAQANLKTGRSTLVLFGTRRLACSSSSPTPMPGSIGRYGCWWLRKATARSGLPGAILAFYASVTQLPTRMPSSKWPAKSPPRSPPPQPRAEVT